AVLEWRCSDLRRPDGGSGSQGELVRVDGQDDGERAAAARLRVEHQPATVVRDNVAADRQTQASALRLTRQRVADLLELLEDAFVVACGDADTRIRHDDVELVGHGPRAQADPSLRSELHRVV